MLLAIHGLPDFTTTLTMVIWFRLMGMVPVEVKFLLFIPQKGDLMMVSLPRGHKDCPLVLCFREKHSIVDGR